MPKSLADSVIIGIQQTTAIVIQVVSFMLTFIIILDFLNSTLAWFGDRVGVEGFTIEVGYGVEIFTCWYFFQIFVSFKIFKKCVDSNNCFG